MYDALAQTCNVAYAMSLIGGKWKVSIIWELADTQSKRLSLLRRKLVGISEGVLIAQLKELEKDGLVRRIDFHKVPPHVEYNLTSQGKLLINTLASLEKWGDECRKATTSVS